MENTKDPEEAYLALPLDDMEDEDPSDALIKSIMGDVESFN